MATAANVLLLAPFGGFRRLLPDCRTAVSARTPTPLPPGQPPCSRDSTVVPAISPSRVQRRRDTPVDDQRDRIPVRGDGDGRCHAAMSAVVETTRPFPDDIGPPDAGARGVVVTNPDGSGRDAAPAAFT